MEKYNTDDSLFKDIQDIQLGSVKEVINEINELIEQRLDLTKELFNNIEEVKIFINAALAKNEPSIRISNEAIKERLELIKKLVEMDEIKLQEKVNNWRDIALLKRELRERIKEFKEKEGSANILDKIIEEGE